MHTHQPTYQCITIILPINAYTSAYLSMYNYQSTCQNIPISVPIYEIISTKRLNLTDDTSSYLLAARLFVQIFEWEWYIVVSSLEWLRRRGHG